MATFVNQKYLDNYVEKVKSPVWNFIADEIMTTVPVTLDGGKYARYDRANMKPVDDRRGVKGDRGEFDPKAARLTDGSFTIEAHDLEHEVQDDEQDDSSEFTSLIEDAAVGLKTTMQITKEQEVAALVAAATYKTTPSPYWDGTSPTIEKDIRTAITAFENQALVSPNTLVISKPVWDKIVMDSTLRNVWLLVPNRADQNIKLDSLMKLLFDNFSEIWIPNTKYDTAKKGKTQSYSWLWGNNVALIYNEKHGTKNSFTWGSRFVKKTWYTTQWRPQGKESTKVAVTYKEDRQQVCSSCLYLLENCLTP
jgi:hypothetical protein